MNIEIFYQEEQRLYEYEERCEEDVEVEQNLESQLSVHGDVCRCCDVDLLVTQPPPGIVIDRCKMSLT